MLGVGDQVLVIALRVVTVPRCPRRRAPCLSHTLHVVSGNHFCITIRVEQATARARLFVVHGLPVGLDPGILGHRHASTFLSEFRKPMESSSRQLRAAAFGDVLGTTRGVELITNAIIVEARAS